MSFEDIQQIRQILCFSDSLQKLILSFQEQVAEIGAHWIDSFYKRLLVSTHAHIVFIHQLIILLVKHTSDLIVPIWRLGTWLLEVYIS